MFVVPRALAVLAAMAQVTSMLLAALSGPELLLLRASVVLMTGTVAFIAYVIWRVHKDDSGERANEEATRLQAQTSMLAQRARSDR